MLQRDRQRQRERGTAGGGGAGAYTAEYLVIAGGGSGGHGYGAGGGAGGYRSSVTGESSGGGASAESALSIALGSPYTVTIGAGGAAVSGGGIGNDGNNSVFGTVVSTGGGGGGYQAVAGRPGGSGGGGGSNGINPGGAGTAGQGYAGAASTSTLVGGGGGGAGEPGNTDGNAYGGDGLASLITGVSVFRGGGGSAANGSTTAPPGGDGGGGGGSSATDQAGDPNTGGGGSGWTTSTPTSGAGGSGVVIIRVPSSVVAEFSAGVVYNYIPLDDFNVYEITAAGVSDTVTFSQGAVTTVGESLRFNDDDTAYLTRTPASAGDRKTWTWSGWVKRGNLVDNVVFQAGSGFNFSHLVFNSNNLLYIEYLTAGPQSGAQTSAVFRDPSAWYHLVVAVDTTQSLESERLKIYINGTLQTYITRSGYPRSAPALNYSSQVNNTILHEIGRSTATFDGYMSDVYFIDGEALDPSRFGKQDADGIWQPISYTGSYGTNGFHLDFADNSTAAALGTDTSGNGNNWTPSGITTDDQVADTPSVNYCTMNPLSKAVIVGVGASPTFSDGNLNVNGNNQDAAGTFGVSSGKWYYEVTQQNSGVFANGVGWYREGTSEESIYRDTGNFRFDGIEAAYGASWQSSGDIIGIALDLDNTTISFYKNGVSQGDAKTNLPAGVYIPLIYCRAPSNLTANFGQRPFAYTPPTGFQALNSSNLPAPTITDGKAHFQPVLYTGNGTTQAVQGLEFQPDFVWIKNRSAADDHKLLDAVRGATEELESNTNGAEVTNSDGLTAFNSNGFTVGADLEYNTSGENFVAWNWNAGGSTVTNTDGSITSQVRANTTAGFSIVSYTGTGGSATVGHGLGAAPAFIIIKERSPTADNWNVYHQTLGNSAWLQLNLANAQSTGSGMWNNTSPTSTVITVNNPGVGGYSNRSGAAYIGYAFAEVDGFSKFGSYTGNGSADGPFVYTGFRPAFIMTKRTDAVNDWGMWDTSRNAHNVSGTILSANFATAEGTSSLFYTDILSNGFKLWSNWNNVNQAGGTYIFMAFAENPFKTARAR